MLELLEELEEEPPLELEELVELPPELEEPLVLGASGPFTQPANIIATHATMAKIENLFIVFSSIYFMV